MGRRYHSKSRRGCTQCKRRHIKCDESQPVCVNCSVSRLQCLYGALPAPTHSQEPNGGPTGIMSPAPSPAVSIQSPLHLQTLSISSPETAPRSSGEQSIPLHQPVNIHHMELLSHFLLETSLIFGPGGHSSATRMALATTLSTPYLVNQVLALSALHVSYLRPDQAKEYAEEAALLQADSLSCLNSTTVEVNERNCVPMLLFSALLGIYTLADAVITTDGNSANFLDKYITYLHVHRGAQAVADGFWDYLRQTEIAVFLITSAHLEHHDTCQHEIEEVCSRLESLLSAADMSDASLKACKDAIQHLKWVLGSLSHAQASDQQASADTIYSWPILLSAEFTNLLAKRSPEALIILAHYAVVLHERREIWVVGGSGSWLIDAISGLLGSYWRAWLVWPNDALRHVPGPGRTLFLRAGTR